MERVPKLEQLVTEETLLILGAGASIDYGFPSWKQLKDDFINWLVRPDIEAWDGFPRVQEAREWWLDRLRSMADSENVDAIAAESEDHCYDLFRLATASVIAEYEAKDDGRRGWVETLSEKYLKVLVDALNVSYPNADEVRRIANNFQVVTLNYDRAFDIRFVPMVKKGFMDALRFKRDLDKYLPRLFDRLEVVYHPHGCLGPASSECRTVGETYHSNVPGRQPWAVPYGDSKTVLAKCTSHLPPIAPVGDLAGGNNPHINSANTRIKTAKNCLIIGVSPDGLRQSHFEGLEAVENVYYGGREAVHNNFRLLNKYASEIVLDL